MRLNSIGSRSRTCNRVTFTNRIFHVNEYSVTSKINVPVSLEDIQQLSQRNKQNQKVWVIYVS